MPYEVVFDFNVIIKLYGCVPVTDKIQRCARIQAVLRRVITGRLKGRTAAGEYGRRLRLISDKIIQPLGMDVRD